MATKTKPRPRSRRRSGTTTIEATGVVKRYGKVAALDGLELVSEPGQVVALLGPNGAGKTTFVRAVSTLLRPDEGSLRVVGHDVAREPAVVRRHIGLAGQFAAVEPAMTGLVGAPRLLLLDEPTTGLDPRSRIELWDAIRGLVQEGTDVLLTTQYLDEADTLASHIVIIDHGRAVAAGTPSQLKRRAAHDEPPFARARGRHARRRRAATSEARRGVPGPNGASGFDERERHQSRRKRGELRWLLLRSHPEITRRFRRAHSSSRSAA